jgi:outer membrane protein assembly factor BamD
MDVFMKKINVLVVLGMLLSLTACKHWWGGDDDDNNPFQGVSAKQLYADSKKEMAKEEYTAAIKRLEALQRTQPEVKPGVYL